MCRLGQGGLLSGERLPICGQFKSLLGGLLDVLLAPSLDFHVGKFD
jgi:hypothetical protein